MNVENTKAQMRKGVLEYCILSVLGQDELYPSDVIAKLKDRVAKLASEVEEFDVELLRRLDVVPGITGLWQVEARDNPNFSAYRRLDLFYLDNWSVSLDLVILVLTLHVVVIRAIRSLVGRFNRLVRRGQAVVAVSGTLDG